MNFSRYSILKNLYFVNDIVLKVVDSFLNPRVYFERKVNYNSHIILTVKKANGILYFMKCQTREFEDPHVTKRLFTALAGPFLEYASVIWGPLYNLYKKKLESAKKLFL